ncbi:hypothetical protein [Tranquillimonas alkanivorans]|uniref:Uncharacterized protein n=1 Tax=Tranquillimonas alkanivorans TaxID=441119 RepID=A0A1I5V2E5_9RHOB|nr:hypothetical protein [Tranquillimonas alkanivorans]SFQ01675.1 hypothetical protein SAMN04488047_12631 [Tranquillimonas alkanivorans]
MKTALLRIAAVCAVVTTLAPTQSAAAYYTCDPDNYRPDPNGAPYCDCSLDFPHGVRFSHGYGVMVYEYGDWCPVESAWDDPTRSTAYKFRPRTYDNFGARGWDETIDEFSKEKTPYLNEEYAYRFNGSSAIDAYAGGNRPTSRFSQDWYWYSGQRTFEDLTISWDSREELVDLAFTRLEGYRSIPSPSAAQKRVFDYYIDTQTNLSEPPRYPTADLVAPSPDPALSMYQYLAPFYLYTRFMAAEMSPRRTHWDWFDEICTFDAVGDQVCPTLTQRVNDDYAIWRATKYGGGTAELRSMTYDDIRGKGARATSGRITPQWEGMSRNAGEYTD